jgi:hypothetical protein
LSVSEPKPEAAIPDPVSRPQPSLSRPASHAPAHESSPAIAEMPSVAASESGAVSSGSVADAPAEVTPPASDTPTTSEESIAPRTQETPDEMSTVSAGQPGSEPEAKSSKPPENVSPDVSASARGFGSFAAILFIGLVALAASVWRLAAGRATRPR